MSSARPFPPEVVMTPAAAELHTPASVTAPARESVIDITIFVSCYNEEKYIIRTIETVRAAFVEAGRPRYEIIVIDDCSSDNSANLVEDYIRTHPGDRILLRRNKRNQGLAQNYFDAAFIGKGTYYRLICGDDAEPFEPVGATNLFSPYFGNGRASH